MKTVSVYEAKTHLSQLLAEVESGEDVVISRNGTPVARLVALARPERGLGSLRDAVLFVADDAFAPMSDDEVAALVTAPLLPKEPR